MFAKHFDADRNKAIKAGHAILKNYFAAQNQRATRGTIEKNFRELVPRFFSADPKGKANKKDKLTL